MKLSLIDFKKHSDLEVELNGNTLIEGKNGEGKTSILEGMVFALFGRNFYGKIATDPYIKEGSPCATAILTIDNTEIKRTSGSENSVYLNGAKSKVAEIGGLFPPVEMALPVINPLYFMYEMSDVDKRELFMKLLPPISREEVFVKHYSDRKDLIDRFRSSNLRNIRDQIKNNEAILEANEGQIFIYETDIKEKDEQIKEIRANMPEAPEGVLEKEKEVQKELDKLQKELGLLGNPEARIEEYKKEINVYKAEIEPIVKKLGVKNFTEASQKVELGKKKVEQKYEELKNEIARKRVVLEQLEQFKDGKCPVCKQPVAEAKDRIEEVKRELESMNEEILTVKVNLDKYNEISKKFEVLRDNVTRCVNGINLHEKNVAKYNTLIKKIKDLESQLVGNSKEEFRNAVEIERQREVIKMLQNEILRKKGTIAKLKDTNEKLRNDLPDLKLLEEALSNRGVDAWIAKEHAKTIEKLISKYMKLNVVTVLENKTNDNTREVFEVTQDGVSFRSMSFGERIKVSVAFGLVLRDLMSNFNLPFVLLDEGSVLSKDSLEAIKKWLNEKGVSLIYTKSSDSKLKIVSENVEKSK